MYKRLSRFLQRQRDYLPTIGGHARRPGLRTDLLPSKKRHKSAASLIENIPSQVRKAYRTGRPIPGHFVESTKGGHLVDLYGYRAFCPFSETYPKRQDSAASSKNKRRRVNFIVLKAEPGSVVVSRKRAAHQEGLEIAGKALLSQARIPGTVVSIMPYGAFVDLGGVDGLLHISEVSDKRIHTMEAVVKEGQMVRVRIISIDPKSKLIALSMKAKPVATTIKASQDDRRTASESVRSAPMKASAAVPPRGSPERPNGAEDAISLKEARRAYTAGLLQIKTTTDAFYFLACMNLLSAYARQASGQKQSRGVYKFKSHLANGLMQLAGGRVPGVVAFLSLAVCYVTVGKYQFSFQQVPFTTQQQRQLAHIPQQPQVWSGIKLQAIARAILREAEAAWWHH